MRHTVVTMIGGAILIAALVGTPSIAQSQVVIIIGNGAAQPYYPQPYPYPPPYPPPHPHQNVVYPGPGYYPPYGYVTPGNGYYTGCCNGYYNNGYYNNGYQGAYGYGW